jgi:ribosomal protein S18 acetylase RimI-like enzyme
VGRGADPVVSELDISPLLPGEAEAAVALWEEAGLTRPWNDPRADIRLALAGPASTVLAGRIDGGLVATAMVGWDGHRGWLYYLAVAKTERRRGYGARMARAAEDWLGAHQAPKIQLLIRAENQAVIAFYEALGYLRSDSAMLQRVLPREPR